MKLTITLLTFLLTVVICRAEKSVVLEQADAPLAITSYAATFQAELRNNYTPHSDQIQHAATYKNISSKDIVAIQLGFVAFDAFNNFMQNAGGGQS
ncbi:MAG TPA: hypothetical protein VF345_04225 [Chthoniobacterales bacterium]